MVSILEEYALKENIPIMQKDGINFLTDFVKKNKIKNILEIGTAIGYSAILMALVDSSITITTIERDYNRYTEAIKNIKKFNLSNQIKVINIDAFDFSTDEKFDLIFIDAAKAQNIKFFNKFENNLLINKYIITDNLNFHGLVEEKEILSKNVKGLVRKIKEYKEFLKQNNNYETTFLNVGDGISISKKIR